MQNNLDPFVGYFVPAKPRIYHLKMSTNQQTHTFLTLLDRRARDLYFQLVSFWYAEDSRPFRTNSRPIVGRRKYCFNDHSPLAEHRYDRIASNPTAVQRRLRSSSLQGAPYGLYAWKATVARARTYTNALHVECLFNCHRTWAWLSFVPGNTQALY